MPKVIIDQTVSLDGFVAGPNDDAKHPLGTRGGERLFDWYQGGEPIHGDKRFAPVGKDRDVVRAMFDAYGAFIAGRKTYDITSGWKGTHPMVKHVFIITHRPPAADAVPKGESTFTFLADIRDAIAQAKQVAGDKAIAIGTCQVARQALEMRLVDELFLHVAPLVLGGGLRLLQLDRAEAFPIRLAQTDAIVGPGATHLRFSVGTS